VCNLFILTREGGRKRRRDLWYDSTDVEKDRTNRQASFEREWEQSQVQKQEKL